MVSFIRLRQRKKVDFPHPDGPISAVTWSSWMVIEISDSAGFSP